MAKLKGINKEIDSRKITGSYTSPVTITAAGGITASTNTDEDIYIVSSSGAVNLTANPQITAGTWEGQTLRLIGTSDTNYITLETGTGLYLTSSWDSLANKVLNLRWSTTNNIWEESAGSGGTFVSEVSDTVYGAGWNGDTLTAPSKNAVYDKIESLNTSLISDTVYGAGWNGDTLTAPSKNAVYDKIESLGTGFVSDVAYDVTSWDGVTTTAPSKNAVRDQLETMLTSISGKLTASNNLSDLLSASTARTNLGLGTLATQNGTFSGTHSGTSSGTNTGDQTITLTGGVTGSGTGSFAATVVTNANLTGPVTSTGNATSVTANAITNTMLAQVSTATFKGRTTAGTGNPEDLTATQATALLNPFTSSLNGVVPASGGGTANFLRADGTFAVPSGTGITALTSDVTASGTGSVAATVVSVGGSSAANVHSAELLANAATSANTASAIVKRDSNGIFQATSIDESVLTTSISGAPTITYTVATAPIQQYTGTASSAIIKLPSATTLNNGHKYKIINRIDGTTLTIQNTGAVAIGAVGAQMEITVTLIDNSTANGVWESTMMDRGNFVVTQIPANATGSSSLGSANYDELIKFFPNSSSTDITRIIPTGSSNPIGKKYLCSRATQNSSTCLITIQWSDVSGATRSVVLTKQEDYVLLQRNSTTANADWMVVSTNVNIIQANTGGTGQSSYTKGDILAAASATVLNKLAVAADGNVLTTDTASTNGIKWALGNGSLSLPNASFPVTMGISRAPFDTILLGATAASTVTLSAASTVPNKLWFFVLTGVGGIIDFVGLAGGAQHTLSAVNQCVAIKSDGTNWYVVGEWNNFGYVKPISTTQTITNQPNTVWYTTVAASTITLTLPTAASPNIYEEFTIMQADAGAGSIVVTAAGAETINGSATQTIQGQFQFLKLKSNGTNWVITTEGRNTAATGKTGQTTYTKGDILVANSATVLNKLPVAANGNFLVADSAATNGVKWTLGNNSVTSTVSAGGTTTLTATSSLVQNFTGTSSQTVVLPNATTLQVGTTYTIIWNSTGIGTVRLNDAATLLLQTGFRTPFQVILTDNSTTNGTWIHDQVVPYSAGTLASSVAVKDTTGALITLRFQSSTVTPVTTAAGTTTLTTASTQVQIFTGTTTQTVVLPNATSLTVSYNYKIVNNSTGILTIQDAGANTLGTIPGTSTAEVVLLTNGSANGVWFLTAPIDDLTGPVTSSSGVTTITANAVTNAKLAQMASNTIKGNNTGGASDPLDLTTAQVKTLLNLTGTNSGDVTLSAIGSTPNANAATLTGQVLNLEPASATFGGVVTTGTQSFAGAKTFTGAISASNLSGTNTGDQTITLTGGVTGSGTGSFATTVVTNANLTGPITSTGNATAVTNNAITNAMLAQMPTLTIKGNNTGGAANVLDLTTTQVTAILNNVVGDTGSGGTKGLVPAPAAGDAVANKFLKADGTFSPPTVVLFAQTATGTVTNTTTETSLDSTGIGSTTLPANFFTAGRSLYIVGTGFHSSVGGSTIQIKIKFGTTVILDTAIINSGNDTNAGIEIIGQITCRTTGATGTVFAQGRYQELGASPNFFQMVNTAATTVDTTTAQVITITATWGTASASNTISLTNLNIQSLN